MTKLRVPRGFSCWMFEVFAVHFKAAHRQKSPTRLDTGATHRCQSSLKSRKEIVSSTGSDCVNMLFLKLPRDKSPSN
jgi:hypothetical protein